MSNRTLGQVGGTVIIRLSRAQPVHRMMKLLLNSLPTRTRAWLRARRSELAVAAGERLVPEKELERKYEEALRFLANQHGTDGVRFFTRLKTITGRWPTGIRKGAEFVMPTMK